MLSQLANYVPESWSGVGLGFGGLFIYKNINPSFALMVSSFHFGSFFLGIISCLIMPNIDA